MIINKKLYLYLSFLALTFSCNLKNEVADSKKNYQEMSMYVVDNGDLDNAFLKLKEKIAKENNGDSLILSNSSTMQGKNGLAKTFYIHTVKISDTLLVNKYLKNQKSNELLLNGRVMAYGLDGETGLDKGKGFVRIYSLVTEGRLVFKPVEIEHVKLDFDSNGRPTVSVKFNKIGGENLSSFSSAHVKEYVALVSRGKVFFNAQLYSKIPNGELAISSGQTKEKLQAIIKALLKNGRP